MRSNFDLIITADHPNRTAEFRLLDWPARFANCLPADRVQDHRGFSPARIVRSAKLSASLRRGGKAGGERRGDRRVHRGAGARGRNIPQAMGVGVATHACIQLPGATKEENHLAAALARVPWEIARPSANWPTLAERNLLLRVVHDMAVPATQPLDLGEDECLRVLFVFAEARGSRPLAFRRERQELRRLFETEIYPNRRLVADFLTHGVTRERLKAQIADRGGYHIVHWSGHGHLNLLELAKPGGARDLLSGGALLDLFVAAGGFIPRLFFLSACHSGDVLRVKDWNDFLAIAQGKELDMRNAVTLQAKDIPLDEQPGYTGTAHALLAGGVPSVVAMRYAVGDDYARELAVEFYRALLAHTDPKNAAAALTMARKSLLDPRKHNPASFAICDHATPVLYGEEQPGLILRKGRSSGFDTRNPRLHEIPELTPAGHAHFVGRTWELAGLGAEFIGSRAGTEVKPVAVITGLGGMGKTALTAEALALWESRFEWVLLYQAKPNALRMDATLRDIHAKLYAELGRYHEYVQARPADAIYRAADAEFTGLGRLERLTRNFVRASRDEAILLVLDNFESNLKPQPEAGSTVAGEPRWACQDPAWDACLAFLATELPGTPSRVLITSRRPLAALGTTACHRVLLGPLPAGEAALYLREHAGLRKMIVSGDEKEIQLAKRLLGASRFHPLLMDRLARLATGGASLRSQLMQALDALEKSHDYMQLPGLFATEPGGAKELAYLSDALATSLDQLIDDAGPDARRLLWMIAVANDPVTLDLLRGVWSGESFNNESARRIKEMLAMLPQLPPELQEKLKAMPSDMRAGLNALPPVPARPDLTPLLRSLVAVGMVTEDRTGPDVDNPNLTCHELVREQICAWMHLRPQDRADLTENAIRLAYAERLGGLFR